MLSLSDLILQSDDHILTSPGGIGGTCVDLANEYLRLCHGAPHQWRNATDWATAQIDGWAYTANSPAGVPKMGDLLIWGEAPSVGIGIYGHIAICVYANLTAIVSFDQNWPAGSACAFVDHSYVGLKGWLTPPSEKTTLPPVAA